MKKQNLILLLIFALLVVVPLVLNPNAEYGGSDGNAKVLINTLVPSYEPWFEPIWEPPSGEIESLMFMMFAVTGAGFIGYYLGTLKGKKS